MGANIAARRKLKGWTQAGIRRKKWGGARLAFAYRKRNGSSSVSPIGRNARLLECSPADLFRSPDEILQEISGKTQVKVQAIPLDPKEEVIRLAEKIILLMQLER